MFAPAAIGSYWQLAEPVSGSYRHLSAVSALNIL
jgi:hypothetical protein